MKKLNKNHKTFEQFNAEIHTLITSSLNLGQVSPELMTTAAQYLFKKYC